MENLNIGVTGAAGYTGSRVVKRLLEEDYEVTPVDNFYQGQVEAVENLEIKDIDVRDFEKLEKELSSVDVIIHLAALSGLNDCSENPDEAFEVNVEGTNNIARICDKHKIPLIHASSMAVIGDPIEDPITSSHPIKPLNLYGKTKAVNEATINHLSRNSFPAYMFVKSNLYGSHIINDTRVTKGSVINYFLERAQDKLPLTVYSPGTQSRDFIHVKDAAEGYLKAVEKITDCKDGAEKMTLASGNSTSVLDTAKKIQDAFEEINGQRPEIERVENPRENETVTEEFNVDTSEASEKIGFEAEIKLEESLKKEVKLLNQYQE